MNTRGQRAKRRRRELDRQTSAIAGLPFTTPQKGWLFSIRESLGMTGQQLARRLGVDPSSVTRMELSEAKRTITLSSLDRVAEKLGCRVVYALVPHESLDTTVNKRARSAAAQLRKPVAHSMSLEDQSLDQQAANDSEELLAEELIARLDPVIWEND